MNIERALSIDGYMPEKDLIWLAERAREHKFILEIGSYYGRSTVAMASNTDGVVYALDDFYGPRNDGVNRNLVEVDRDKIYNKFLTNIMGINNIIPFKHDHRTFYPKQDYDMVFIDGSHIYEDVKDDISKFLQMRGCLLCGHDMDFPTVQQAVDELLVSYSVVYDSTIWYKQL